MPIKINIDDACWVIAHVSNNNDQYVYGLKFAIMTKGFNVNLAGWL